MTIPAYPAAAAAARRVHPHFAQHLAANDLSRSILTSSLADVETIEAILDVAFWASLRREEGYSPRISLAYVTPEQVKRPLTFEKPLTLNAQMLTRLAPAVERPGIHLGICHRREDLIVWGATRSLPASCLVVEVIAPGLLLIKESRGEEAGKFTNVAVLEGDQIKVIDARSAIPDCPTLLTALLGLQHQSASADTVNVLVQLAVSMRTHGRGGSLLVVPKGVQTWRDSILAPITYSVEPAFSALAELAPFGATDGQPIRRPDTLRRAVDGIAGLTAVDGATVITDQYDLLAFGAKIIRRAGCEQVVRVIVTEPIEGVAAVITEPGQLGGTRHLSAAQFTHDQRDSIALVASQDGRFTVFGWSPCEHMVHAHRIETLLL